MNLDYLDAHERHWEDAELLMKTHRFANADHLYGISAECGLKRLMQEFGMLMAGDKPKIKDDNVHADKVLGRFESYRSGHHFGTNYMLAAQNPFHNWSISDRYAHRREFNSNIVANHRKGADEVRNLLKKAKLEGILP
ncbi:MAG: hypothetical protein WCI81_05140 [Chlorobiaceae bacterium]|jgi:hypothetical protein